MMSNNNSFLIPAIILLIVLIAIIKAKSTDRPVGLDTIIYDKVDKRKYPKIYKAKKSNNNKGSDKLNSQSGQDDSLF